MCFTFSCGALATKMSVWWRKRWVFLGGIVVPSLARSYSQDTTPMGKHNGWCVSEPMKFQRCPYNQALSAILHCPGCSRCSCWDQPQWEGSNGLEENAPAAWFHSLLRPTMSSRLHPWHSSLFFSLLFSRLLWFAHLQMFRCVYFLDMFMCWAENFLLNYRRSTCS